MQPRWIPILQGVCRGPRSRDKDQDQVGKVQYASRTPTLEWKSIMLGEKLTGGAM